MGRKKHDNNPVSLFAFQDIITSITGIMVLVVLLIILDIIDHKKANSEPPKPSPYKEEISKLTELEQGLRTKLEKDKEWLSENQKNIVQALSLDLDSLPNMLEIERKINLKLKSAIKTTKKECVQLESMILQTKEIIHSKTKDLNGNQKKIEEITKKIKLQEVAIQEQIAKIKQLKKKHEESKNRVEIRTSSDLKKNPVFVECSKNEIKTKIIKTSLLKTFTNNQHNPQILLRDFYNWLKKTRNPDNECVVVIVKPSFAEFTAHLIELLRREGFSYNMEPMEENKTGVYE